MPASDLILTLIEYHHGMTRRVWESILGITDDQFTQEDGYSRGSIRNLMIHITSTDRRWLAGLRNEPDAGHLAFTDFPSRQAGKDMFEQVAGELQVYSAGLTDQELDGKPDNIPATRIDVLMHLINHGTDHRATVLQMLYRLGASTFEQDLITWLWQRERGE